MSQYTTGEIAKLCGVSVRTVQYYDTRGVLSPGALSGGGRRLYDDGDLEKLKIICFLREAGLSVGGIAELLHGQEPEKVIAVLADEQEKSLQKELADCRKKLALLGEIRRSLKSTEHFSLESLGDIARVMKNKQRLNHIRTVLLATAIPFGIMEWSSLFLWIFQGIWWPFALYALLAVPYIFWIFRYYHGRVSYICPQCHAVFRPGKKEAFFARHTFAARKLTCPCCGSRGFCIETCEEEGIACEQA